MLLIESTNFLQENSERVLWNDNGDTKLKNDKHKKSCNFKDFIDV